MLKVFCRMPLVTCESGTSLTSWWALLIYPLNLYYLNYNVPICMPFVSYNVARLCDFLTLFTK